LCQREVFRQQRPLWARQLELPLAPVATAVLVGSSDHRHQLVGLFGRSLIHANWSFLHPNFRNYSCCLMACVSSPTGTATAASVEPMATPRCSMASPPHEARLAIGKGHLHGLGPLAPAAAADATALRYQATKSRPPPVTVPRLPR
jgi:hypothetical protein